MYALASCVGFAFASQSESKDKHKGDKKRARSEDAPAKKRKEAASPAPVSKVSELPLDIILPISLPPIPCIFSVCSHAACVRSTCRKRGMHASSPAE